MSIHNLTWKSGHEIVMPSINMETSFNKPCEMSGGLAYCTFQRLTWQVDMSWVMIMSLLKIILRSCTVPFEQNFLEECNRNSGKIPVKIVPLVLEIFSSAFSILFYFCIFQHE